MIVFEMPIILVLLDVFLFQVEHSPLFLHEKLLTERASLIQIKPHRLLKNEDHIRFFYDNQINISLS